MAPRGRPRKVGKTRMAAAVDAMSPFGFSPDFTRRKVKELLKVYGGDEGWPFIEEGSYSVLIEYMLDDQSRNDCQEGEPSHKNEDGDQGNMAIEPVEAGPSQEPCEPLGNSQEASESFCNGQDTSSLSPVTVLNPLLPPAEPVVSPGSGHSAPETDLASPGYGGFYWQQAQPKRKPCLGLIGSKDDEDFVLLKPAPVPVYRPGKRKSRWDYT